MPIRPENRHRYPADWRAISQRIRFHRAGGRCERCGVRHGAVGYRDEAGRFHEARAAWTHEIRIVLTVAHLNHQPEDCRDENLMALCQRCHNRHDAPARQAGMRARRFGARAAGDLFEGAQSGSFG